MHLTMQWSPICLGGALLLCFLTVHVRCTAVMSVDLGNEWMKVGVVSPGVPMEIALNKESKRKTPAVVAFRDGVRSFGEDAQVVGLRFPANSYAYLLDLLGKKLDHPIVALYQLRFPYYKLEADPERGTVLFRHDDNTVYSVEELIAQLLSKSREMAEQSTGQTINECVLTVPGYFNQAERRAFLQAASLADLKVLQLINDYTAVALNYGIFRRKEINDTSHYIMFYDMGAHKTTASIVEYKIVKTKEKGFVESNPQLQIIGVGYDRTLGGLEIALRLRDFLAVEFNNQKKTTNDITKNGRAMAKLLKEANRVKTVLSANNDFYAQIEGLIDEKDYKLQVSRETLESLCQDLFERVPKPIESALKNAGLSMDVINQVILVGAGTRVPRIQEILQKTIKSELSKNINADEAATLGAAYRAADLSVGFKVKPFITKDAVLFPIQVTFERTVEGNLKQIKRTLFNVMNPYPQKKVITFNKHVDDFEFNVNYADLDHLSKDELQNLGELNISQVKLIGVSDVVGKNQGENIESKGIKAHFQMDDSGILNLVNVELVLEKTVLKSDDESPFSKLGSTISKLFSGENDKPTQPEQKEEESEAEKKSENEELTKEVPKDEDSKNKTGEVKEDLTAGNDTEKAVKPKVITVKEPIVTKEYVLMVPQLNDDQYKKSLKKIEELNLVDEQRTRRETALNLLESFVIEAQSRMDVDEYSSCGTKEEVEKIRKNCNEVSDWLYEDGSDAAAEQYESKLYDLRKLTDDLYEKHYEHSERPDALKAMKSLLNGSEAFLTSAKNLTKDVNPDKDVFTTVEIETLTKAIDETKKWRDSQIAEQKKIKRHEPVILTIKAITEKMASLDREVKYLVNKIKIWKPKVKAEPKVQKQTIENDKNEQLKDNNDSDEKSDTATELPDLGVSADILEELDALKTVNVTEDKHSEL